MRKLIQKPTFQKPVDVRLSIRTCLFADEDYMSLKPLLLEVDNALWHVEHLSFSFHLQLLILNSCDASSHAMID